jgi:signal transduction histidine kinase/DNA-binding response OmpR family regulator
MFERGVAVAAVAVAAAVAVTRLRGTRLLARQQELERLVEERTATIAEQTKKLRELDRLKSQLFANVSHEFRSPLTLVIGPLQDALAGDFGPLSGDLARQLAMAVSNAQRLLGLVDQLLDVARLESGRLRLSVWRSDLAALARRTVEPYLPFAERRGIGFSLEAPAEPVEAWFDETQLEKVFANLLSNALKFTPPGGTVRVAVQAPEAGDRVLFIVQDDGPGIPADQLERIFDRFHQTAVGRIWPGAGIGLAFARQLVELHGGTIKAESREGHGATFTVSLLRGRDHFPADLVTEGPDEPARPAPPGMPVDLPLDPAGSETAEQTATAAEDEDRTTVLVVDDHAEMRAYVRRHLEPAYRVIEAADGAAALDQVRHLPPDLVVSDVMMPGLEGNALFRALREDPELDLVPVVLLTAKASAESRIEGLRDGVDDYLVKPFDPRELRARVDNLLASRKRLLERFDGKAPRSLRVSEIDVTPADEAFLARVQAKIEARLGDTELTVEALAAALGCDRSYLLRKLRALTGETPSELIRSFRLQRAEQLLRAGAGAVSEVAYTVGFKSVAHFSNAFQNRYGERPSAFASRHRPQ